MTIEQSYINLIILPKKKKKKTNQREKYNWEKKNRILGKYYLFEFYIYTCIKV